MQSTARYNATVAPVLDDDTAVVNKAPVYRTSHRSVPAYASDAFARTHTVSLTRQSL